MKLFSEVICPSLSDKIDYDSQILVLGSCFATHMAERLLGVKFKVTQNPYGVLFHPKAILKSLQLSCGLSSEKQKIYDGERWHSFSAHSKLSASSEHDLNANLARANTSLQQGLKNASHIIITLGTAWYYQLKSTGKFVSNCHKFPTKDFSKHLSSTAETKHNITELISTIRAVNSSVQLIFTISPVKHLKDGLIDNNRSKSVLNAALHEVLDDANLSNVIYFPSFELVNDQLRDYRFYKEDLAHPNATAVSIVWEAFKMACINPAIFTDMQRILKIQKALAHRPFDVESESHKKFKFELSSKIAKLQTRYPHLNFD